MSIEELAGKFQEIIIKFLEHKDFSESGHQVFKALEREILQFTKVAACIQMCIYILNTNSYPSVQYFASKFLKDKLMYDFDQLHPDVIGQTHQELIRIINKYPKASDVVVTNLSLCLVFTYIQYADRVGGILDFLKQSFPNIDTSPSTFQYFFKVLELLPEEITNSKVVIDEEKRQHVLELIEQQQKNVLVQMHLIVTTINTQYVNQHQGTLIRLFGNWLEIGYNADVVNGLFEHSLLHLSFSCLSCSLVTEDATRTIETVIDVIRSPEENQQLFQFLAQNLFQILGRVGGYLENDIEIAENCIRILSIFGDKSARVFVEKYDEKIREYLLMMVNFTKIQDISVFEELIDFWDTLLFQFNNLESNAAMTKKDGTQIASALFEALCLRLRYSLANLEELNTVSESQYYERNENIDDLYEYRDKARDVFEKISDFLSHQLYLLGVIKLIKGMPNLQENKQQWSLLQSYLFSLRDVLKDYPCLSNQIVELVQMYDKIIHPYEQIRKDFIRIFEQLFSIKQKNPDFLNKLFSNIIELLKNDFLADRAEKAFEKGCKQNPEFLTQNIELVLQIYLNNPHRQHILKGIINVLRKKPEIMKKYLPEILKHPLEVLRSSKVKAERIQSFDTFYTALNAISESESNYLQEILYSLMTELWPILKNILANPTVAYTEEDRLIERSCKLLKLIMRRMKPKFLDFIQDIFSTIISVYKSYPVSPFVYLLEIAITVYGGWQAKVVDYLQNLYLQFYEITIYHVSTIENSLSVLQYLIDDFLGLHIRIFVYNSSILLNTGKVEEILKFTSKCLVSGLPKLASSASHLFESIFMIYWMPYSREKYKKEGYGEVVTLQAENVPMYAELRNLLRPSVPGMIQELFCALGGVPPEFVRDNVIDCLKAVILAFPVENLDLWQVPLQSLNQDILTQTEKNKFKEHLSKLSSNSQEEFSRAELKLSKLLYTITKRYMHRKKREKIGNQE